MSVNIFPGNTTFTNSLTVTGNCGIGSSMQVGGNLSVVGNVYATNLTSSGGVTSISGATGALSLSAGTGIIITQNLSEFVFTSTGTSGVSSISGATGAISLTAGSGITITKNLSDFTFTSTGTSGVSSISGATGALSLSAGTGITITQNLSEFVFTSTGTSGVSQINTLTGAVTLSGGSGITILPSGQELIFSSTGGVGNWWTISAGGPVNLSGYAINGISGFDTVSASFINSNVTIGSVYGGSSIVTPSLTNSVILGTTLVNPSSSGYGNILIGNSTGGVFTGDRNTFIGYNCLGGSNTGSCNVLIGNGLTMSNTSNTLQIGSGANAVIQADFLTNQVGINQAIDASASGYQLTVGGNAQVFGTVTPLSYIVSVSVGSATISISDILDGNDYNTVRIQSWGGGGGGVGNVASYQSEGIAGGITDIVLPLTNISQSIINISIGGGGMGFTGTTTPQLGATGGSNGGGDGGDGLIWGGGGGGGATFVRIDNSLLCVTAGGGGGGSFNNAVNTGGGGGGTSGGDGLFVSTSGSPFAQGGKGGSLLTYGNGGNGFVALNDGSDGSQFNGGVGGNGLVGSSNLNGGGGGGAGYYGGGGGGASTFSGGGGGGSSFISTSFNIISSNNYNAQTTRTPSLINPSVPSAGTGGYSSVNYNAFDGAVLLSFYNTSLSYTNPALYVTGDVYAEGGVCYGNGDIGFIANILSTQYSPSLFTFSNSGLYRMFAYTDTVPGVYSDTTFAVTSNTAALIASNNAANTIACSLNGTSNSVYVQNASTGSFEGINWRISQLL